MPEQKFRNSPSLANFPTNVASLARLKQLAGSQHLNVFLGKPGYNVLEMDRTLPLDVSKGISRRWLDDAINRGDELILKTDPIQWDQFMREIGKESFYNELELPQRLRKA